MLKVAAVKRLHLLHHSVDYSFISFEITEPILVTLKMEYRFSRGHLQPRNYTNEAPS